MTEKQKVSELENINHSSNDHHIMVLTDTITNQLRKEKISDFITDTVSKDNNNGLIKGNDDKLFVIDATNADNISTGILNIDRLPDSGVNAKTYPYPVNLNVNSKGQILSVEAGEPGANNANTDLSNITENGKEIIMQYGNSRNIGEIVTSTVPLSDAGLHLADGSVLQSGGIYDAFVQHMAKLYETSPEIFCTEEEYQQSLTNYGVCGKYVYDSTANTVRLSTITGHIEGTSDVAKLGNIIEAGLPNITGEFARGGINNSSGAFAPGASEGFWGVGANGQANYFSKFDASLSSSIYKDNFNKVQTQSIEVLYYIVVANSTKTDIQVNIDNVITDLNGKADVTLGNVIPEQSFVDKSIDWGMPDYSKAVTFTPPAAGGVFTVPYDCFIKVTKANVGGALTMKLNDNTGPSIFVVASATSSVFASDSGFFKKDTKLYIQENNVTSHVSYICPLKGVSNA